MIKELRVSVTYLGDKEPREYHRDYLGVLSFRVLGEAFGDDFWELIVASVLPYPNQSNVDLIRDFIEAEIDKRLKATPEG